MSSQSSFGDSDKENSTPSALRTPSDLKSQRRVLFSPLPDLLRPSIGSRPDSFKLPKKSVLKTTTPSPASSPVSERPDPATTNILFMIESAIQSLSGSDRASKVETYTTLSNLFRAFENVPDRRDLIPRLPELFSLILADVSRYAEEDASIPDYPLNSKALKVAGFILFDHELAGAVPGKLARSLLEHSLSRMEKQQVSKATTTQFLWLWQTQHLPRTVLSADIAERILITTMKADFPSLIVNQERMTVLSRLLDQARDVMIKNVDVWLPRVVNYMLDDNKLIRTAALRIALEAGKHLCKIPAVGRCVQNYLKSEVDGVPFIQVTSDRFKHIIQESDGGIYVAHAWGSICTLSSSQNPEKSKTLMAWMHVLQIVFNSPATENKVMAQSAWTRMIHYFCNNEDIVYREKNLAYLTKPMSRMLSSEVKVYDTVRMAAVNTVCSLLYALLRPGITSEQASLVWYEAVDPLISVMLESHQKNALQQRAVDILSAVLEPKPLEPWTLERLLDGKVGTESEINHFDARWVRSHTPMVTSVILTALRSSASEESKLKLWTVFAKSLRLAGAKEIQISAETMDATASICTVLRSLWTAPLPVQGSPSNSYTEDVSQRTQFIAKLVLISFDILGTIPFTEKMLSFPDGADVKVAYPPSKEKGSTMRPGVGCGLKFVFELFQHPTSPSMLVDNYIELLETITNKATSPQKSLAKCLGLLSQCLSCIPKEKKKTPVQSWKILAEIAATRLAAETTGVAVPAVALSATGVNTSHLPVVIELLSFGASVQHGVAYDEWLHLAEAFARDTRKSFGRVGVNQSVVEPLAQMLLDTNCLQAEYLGHIIGFADLSASDAPLSTSVAKSKPVTNQMDDELPITCTLLSKALIHMSTVWKKYQLNPELRTLFEQIAVFFDDIDSLKIEATLLHLLPALTHWVVRYDEGPAPMLNATLRLFGRLPRLDSALLERLEHFLIRCFESDAAHLRHLSLIAWNLSFGKLPRLTYPDKIVRCIQDMDLAPGQMSLPTFPVQDPEVSDSPGAIVVSLADAPPKMSNLLQASSQTSTIPRRARSASRSSSKSRKNQRESLANSTGDAIKQEPRKRKRESRPSSAPTSSTATSPVKSIKTESPIKQPQHKASPLFTPSRKRQRRTRTSEAGSPSRIPDTALPHSPSTMDDGDGVFTLRKRELRATSPQIFSDPISESSPSVYTRYRRLSSQEAPLMDELRQSVQSLSPHANAVTKVHVDNLEQPDEAVLDGVGPDVISPAKEEILPLSIVTSDDLMQLQVHDHVTDLEAQDTERDDEAALPEVDSVDEDLFILQLQQYRQSLNQGRPITPRRRQKLGLLMKEMASLSTTVTEAYFDSHVT